MSEKTFFWAMLLTLGLCLASACLEHFFDNDTLGLVILGPQTVFWDLVFSPFLCGALALPSFGETILLLPLIMVYYGLFYMPILIARNSAATAMIWGAFFLAMHIIFYDLASSPDF